MKRDRLEECGSGREERMRWASLRVVRGVLAVFVLLGSLLSGGQERLSAEPSSPMAQVSMVVRLLDQDRHPLPDKAFAGEVTLLLPFLPGTLVGQVESGAAIRKQVQVGDRLHLDPAALERRLKTIAPRWDEVQSNQGLHLVPPETRLVRLGLLSLRGDDDQFFDHTLFVDPETHETLWLVYVDRACSISGVGQLGNARIEPRLELPGAGLHWLRVESVKPEHLVVHAATSVAEATVGLILQGERGTGPAASMRGGGPSRLAVE